MIREYPVLSDVEWQKDLPLCRSFLDACPCCGSSNLWGPYYKDKETGSSYWAVSCNSDTCLIEMTSYEDTPYELFKAWNKRSFNVDSVCDALCLDNELRLMLKLKFDDNVTTE